MSTKAKSIRVVVEVVDEDGERFAGCERDGCVSCGWARQTATIDLTGPEFDITGQVTDEARDAIERLLGMNEAAKKRGHYSWD